MEKYLVIREYILTNTTPTVAARFEDYDAANIYAKTMSKNNEYIRYWVYEQSKEITIFNNVSPIASRSSELI